ncbi:MAG: hypothetical protein P0Y56_02530 [Candidatus Andeanibacterium colombiense]|uniref:Uncharacterized protein n=1 Tax=Candidatus Andeanibacterium colombiense TaxID=3121345 RepID=A0AAJ5X7S0_9SPHN|nr:MAG: hypothetical protein P0Y56_02530 [Sphingomonadaceae bacterium]
MEQRVATALARIEAAAARIEAAARANAARAAQPAIQTVATASHGDDQLLAMKHAQLRATVGATLKELDMLIGSLEHG